MNPTIKAKQPMDASLETRIYCDPRQVRFGFFQEGSDGVRVLVTASEMQGKFNGWFGTSATSPIGGYAPPVTLLTR